MQYYFDLIKHFIVANSRHGTHSPFVYAMADQVIYSKANFGSAAVSFPPSFPWRYRKLLAAILLYMEIQELATLNSLQNEAAVWINPEREAADNLFELLEEGRVMVIHEPYRAKQRWNQLVTDPRVIVSINLFHFGILLRRDGQRKENFRLRYPYGKDK